jgi:hypothetical protein
MKRTGELYEITVAGRPQCYRDVKATAIASAEYFKQGQPDAEVAVRNVESGEITVIAIPLRRRSA